MTCRICGNPNANIPMTLTENLHGTKDVFSYFQCSVCECIQIAEIPPDIGKYYPQDYYAFDPAFSDKYMNKPISAFKKIQAEYIVHGKHKILGKLFTAGYKPPRLYTWLKNLNLSLHDKVLDIGCGNGVYLKQMHQLGYTHLTGVDPFIDHDYTYSETFRIYKTEPINFDENTKFDCIMMHHSFEHMDNEGQVLKKAARLLSPKGRILIRIPIYSKPLLEKYGSNLASLDAPRHFYVHSVKSMTIMTGEAKLKIDKIDYDADYFSFWGSEEYINNVRATDKNSLGRNRRGSIFTEKQLETFKTEIKRLNEKRQSDCAAFYISAAPK